MGERSRNTSVVLEEMLGETMEMVESVKMRTRNLPDVAGLFLDKWSNMGGEDTGLDPKYIEQVSKKFADDFQNIEDKNMYEKNEFTIKNTFEHMPDDDSNEDDSEGLPFSLVLAPDVMKVLRPRIWVFHQSQEEQSVRGEQLTPWRPGSSPPSGCSASL